MSLENRIAGIVPASNCDALPTLATIRDEIIANMDSAQAHTMTGFDRLDASLSAYRSESVAGWASLADDCRARLAGTLQAINEMGARLAS